MLGHFEFWLLIWSPIHFLLKFSACSTHCLLESKYSLNSFINWCRFSMNSRYAASAGAICCLSYSLTLSVRASLIDYCCSCVTRVVAPGRDGKVKEFILRNPANGATFVGCHQHTTGRTAVTNLRFY